MPDEPRLSSAPSAPAAPVGGGDAGGAGGMGGAGGPGGRRRPKHLNLLKIHLPLPGVLSILHRVSGVILALALPVALGALQVSLGSAEGYECVAEFFSHPLMKLVVWGTAWALFHHLCAGVRFLALDFHFGVELGAARKTATAAFVVSIVMTLAFGAWLWL